MLIFIVVWASAVPAVAQVAQAAAHRIQLRLVLKAVSESCCRVGDRF
jgi:hypothetical protein